MTAAPWINSTKELPICDIPWVGQVGILVDGDVKMCCSSPATVGNINEQPFEEIWNNETYQRVRASLTRGEFPSECAVSSCPLYRGDATNHLHSRKGLGDASAARQMVGELDANPTQHPGVHKVRVEITSETSFTGDVVCALVDRDGGCRFLPERSDYAVPVFQKVQFLAGETTTFEDNVECDDAAAIAVAVCRSGANPYSVGNVHWVATVDLD